MTEPPWSPEAAQEFASDGHRMPEIVTGHPALTARHGSAAQPLAGLSGSPTDKVGPEQAAPEEAEHEASRQWGRLRFAGRILALFVIMCGISAPLVAYQVHHNPGLSPTDEVAYVDYINKVHRGHVIVGNGEKLDSVTVREQACLGIPPVRKPDPAVCQEASPAPGGRNSADIDPPTYYVLTDLGARAIMAMRVAHDLITAARLVGIAWAGASLTVLFLLARTLGASRISSAIACVATLATAGILKQWYHVTPHATDLLVGGLATLAAIGWQRRQIGSWVLVLCGLVPVLVKATGATIVVALVLFLLADALWPMRGNADGEGAASDLPDRRRSAIGALLVVAGVAVGSVAWLAVRHHYALTTSNAYPQFDVTSFQARWLVDAIGTFTESYQGPALAGIGTILTVWIYGSTVRFATAMPGAAAMLRQLSLAALITALFGAWLFIVSNYVLIHQHVGIPSRYGLTLFPLVVSLGALNLRQRIAQIAGALYAAALVVLAFHGP